MHPSIPSVAVLSSSLLLFVSTPRGHAFAPPRLILKSSSSTETRLRARVEKVPYYEVLLKEIDNDATNAAASDVVAEPIVEAASTVVTPSTPVGSDVADSALDAITKAATVAQDAADAASAAASAFAVKSVTATKSAAVAASAAAGASASFQLQQFKPIVSDGVFPKFDADGSARQREILWADFLEGTKGIRERFDIPTLPKMNVDLPTLGSSSSLASGFATLVATLHLKEYGGWYAAGVMAILASVQRSAGKKEAMSAYESELARAREKAMEAAKAAGAAADGAKTAKMLAMQMEKDMAKDGSKALLESSRSKMTQIEKEMMEKEMRALKAEVTSLRSKLPRTEKVKVTTISFKDIKTEIEEEYPTKIVMESDPDEDSRIIEILKLLDEENATKKQKAEGMEKKREEEANFVAAEKAKLVAAEKAVAEAEDFAIKAAAEAKKVLAAKKAADEKRRIDEATAAAAREAVEKMLEEETKSKTMTKGVETAQAKAETVKKTATRKAAAKSATLAAMKSDDGKSTTKKATVIDSDDWSTLSESTLKRKSVAQLNEYLTRKGAAVSHQDGKSMNKSELLEAVKSLKISV